MNYCFKTKQDSLKEKSQKKFKSQLSDILNDISITLKRSED